jgi:hypothetical protein
MHKGICAIRDCKKENLEFERREKNEEIISRNCLAHHKRASTFINMHKATPLHFLPTLLRYYPMSEGVQRDGSRDCKKENPDFERREENEEIISINCLPHHKIARTFINKHKATRLHLLAMLSSYYPTSESVQHDEQWSSLHGMICFRYDDQCSSLHAEGLRNFKEFDCCFLVSNL